MERRTGSAAAARTGGSTPHSGGSDPVTKFVSRYSERKSGKLPPCPQLGGRVPASWFAYSELRWEQESSDTLCCSVLHFVVENRC